MTISATNRADAVGNDAATVFPYAFKIFAATDLEVKVKKTSDGTITTLTYPTQYTVSGVGAAAGGNVTLVDVDGAWQNASDGTLKTGYTIAIRRVVDVLQETDVRNQGGFHADVHEDAFDYLTMIDQQQQDDLDRSVKLDSAYQTALFDMTLPAPSAGFAIGWNDDEDGLANIAALGSITVPISIANLDVSAFIATLLDDASAALAQATLLLGTKSTVACAASTADIWTGTGTLIDFTGSTGPVTAFPAAPRAGIQRVLLCASTPTFTHGANLVVPGGADYTAAAGDIIVVTAETTTKFRLSIFKADGTAVAVAAAATPLARGYIDGCTLSNNSGDATNDIDIAAGVCRDSTNTANITVAALTKQLDANWAAGTNQGMRYSGAAIADTTYGIWAVATAAQITAGTSDFYAYPNSGAPSAATVLAALQAESGGSSYLYVRRIGFVVRVSGAIKAFTQYPEGEVRWSVPVMDVNASNPGTSAVLSTVTTPLGTKCIWRGTAGIRDGTSAAVYGIFTSPDQTDSTPTSSLHDCRAVTGAGTVTSNTSKPIVTNTSSQIRSRIDVSSTNDQVYIFTDGYKDFRGAE